MSKRAEIREKFISAITATGQQTITTDEIKSICSKIDIAHPYWFTNDDANRVKRGVYKVPAGSQSMAQTIDMQAQVIPMPKQVDKSNHKISNITTDLDETNLVPTQYKNYVPFGNYDDV
jgi:hypothetical protein